MPLGLAGLPGPSLRKGVLTAGAYIVKIDQTPKKIMVVDDSNTIRRSAALFLEQSGLNVVLAEDGFDALTQINEESPDLIFCDIAMPRLDGYQTCAIIKRNSLYAGVPVIMLSSKDGIFDRARGRAVGSEHYLTKPFTKMQLLEVIQQFSAVQGVSE